MTYRTIAKVRRSGIIVIPYNIRRAFGIVPGDMVDVTLNGVVERVEKEKRGEVEKEGINE